MTDHPTDPTDEPTIGYCAKCRRTYDGAPCPVTGVNHSLRLPVIS